MDKKYTIIPSIENDISFGDINWYTISFLTDNFEKTKFLYVKGFKIHNAYTNIDLANEDAKKIKEQNVNLNIYISQIGKLYSWDDATKTDTIEYDDEKLNDLEKSRKENIDKIKLVEEQYKNENNKKNINKQRERLRKKLYEKGSITKKEYEMMVSKRIIKKEIGEINNEEIEECYKTDYLDENNPIGFKYGCVSIYSPNKIGGLNTLCFKIRGIFQTINELNDKIFSLEKLYPNDMIHTFEIGKWCGFSELDDLEPIMIIKRLNYLMKCYIDNIDKEKIDFEKRKSGLNKVDKKEENKEKKKENKEEEIVSFGKEDKEIIKNILEYIEDPEINGKYTIDKNKLETISLDIKK